MRINRLELQGFRNYGSASCDFAPDVNVITGRNAQGKTNLLEAVYYLSSARSFRTRLDRELIGQNADAVYLQGDIFSGGRPQRLEINFSRGGRKKLFANGAKLSSAGELSGRFCCTLFAPEDLDLIKGGAAARRKYMDLAISQLRPQYSELVTRFGRIYEQKTRILKDYRERADMLEALDEFSLSLCKTGAELIRYRASWCVRASQAARRIHGEISGRDEQLRMQYTTVPEVEDPLHQSQNEILNALLRQQERLRRAELDAGQCLAGVQKDDILLEIGGLSARSFASQGQIRTAALSMKLAEWNICREETGESPVLLLDDVLSELDPVRQDYVLNSIRGGQVLITCCDEQEVMRKTGGKAITVDHGRIFYE